jgi:hypothetical protein
VPFVAIPNTVKTVTSFEHPERPLCQVVMHHRAPAGGPYLVGTLINLADAMMNAWSAHFSGSISHLASVLEVVCTDLDSATGNQGSSTHAAFPGTASADVVPPGVALCTSVYTLTRGRSFRGRIFLPCVSVADLTANGSWNASFCTAISAAYFSMEADVFAAVGFHQVVASRKLASSAYVDDWRTNTIIRHQRRRETDH